MSGATPGACLAVSFDDGRLVQVTSGLSDVDLKIPMTNHHRLPLGSSAGFIGSLVQRDGAAFHSKA